jgi:hypothetical protein
MLTNSLRGFPNIRNQYATSVTSEKKAPESLGSPAPFLKKVRLL